MIFKLVEAALQKNHTVEVFFYEEGVYHVEEPHDWQNLFQKYALSWTVCSGSLQRRGIWSLPENTGFVLGGLAQFMESLIHAERVLTFYP